MLLQGEDRQLQLTAHRCLEQDYRQTCNMRGIWWQGCVVKVDCVKSCCLLSPLMLSLFPKRITGRRKRQQIKVPYWTLPARSFCNIPLVAVSSHLALLHHSSYFWSACCCCSCSKLQWGSNNAYFWCNSSNPHPGGKNLSTRFFFFWCVVRRD